MNINKVLKPKTNIQRIAKREFRRAFSLLELLLVIAIIAVLAGIIVFALKPADTIQKANSAKLLSDQSSLKKALNSYIVDNGGSLPTVFNTLTYGYYDICRQGQSGSCVSLDELVSSGKLAQIPVDSSNGTATLTGFKVKYNPVKTELGVYTTGEYTQWAQSAGLTLSDGLVGYWKMDASTGSAQAEDSSGNGNTGTWSGTGTNHFTSGKFGNGGGFNGSNDYISVADSPSLSPTSAVTISSWVYTASNFGSWTIVGKDNTFQNQLVADNKIQNSIYCSGIWTQVDTTSNPLIPNSWNHVVIVFDGNKQKIYANGNLVQEWNLACIINDSASNLFIGSWTGVSEFFNGSIDEVRIYNRALNSTEIKALYDIAPGPIAYWKFDASTGSAQAEDSSGNGYVGTLVNGPTWVQGKFNNGLQLDGVDDFIPITINVPETNYTYSTWFKTSDTSGSIITAVSPVNPTAGGHDRQFGIYNSGKFCHRVWNDEIYCSPNLINDNKWHYAAVTVGSGGGKLYIDGVQVATGAKSLSDFTSESGVIIGNHSYWGAYSGIIDDLKIYNYVRTPAQILWDYNQGI